MQIGQATKWSSFLLYLRWSAMPLTHHEKYCAQREAPCCQQVGQTTLQLSQAHSAHRKASKKVHVLGCVQQTRKKTPPAESNDQEGHLLQKIVVEQGVC